MFRIILALLVGAITFVIGLCLPLILFEIFYGDPGMPGGAGMIFLGLPIGLAAGITAGLFAFYEFPKKAVSK